jgi:hypothetical protein
MNYYIWDSPTEKVYQGRRTHFTKEEVKQRITEKREDVPQAGVYESVFSSGEAD